VAAGGAHGLDSLKDEIQLLQLDVAPFRVPHYVRGDYEQRRVLRLGGAVGLGMRTSERLSVCGGMAKSSSGSCRC
jgi:hypothetical protein